MYIKIGTTNIKYSSSLDDYMIISEVIDSKMSYEKPRLVRTSDELDIWFGRDFSDRSYLDELIKSNVTLFLYKPISEKLDSNSDNYIDIDKYKDTGILYYTENDLPKEGVIEEKYRLRSDDGEYIDKDTGLKFDFVIWYESQYVYVKDLPQNLNSNNTISLNNRDVLCINYKNYNGPSFVYPDYSKIESSKYNIDKETLLNNLPDQSKIVSGDESLAYDINISDDIIFDKGFQESPYIIISGLSEDVLIYFDSGDGIPNIAERYYSRAVGIEVNNRTNEEILDDLFTQISKLNYIVEKKSNNSYLIYSSFKTIAKYFYNLPGFSMTPNFDATQDILSQISSNCKRINFISKTIGTVDDKIKISIEKLTGDDNYRIVISRFEYSEVYEGGLFNNRIDYKITNNSKLVTCELVQSYVDSNGISKTYKKDFKDNERDSGLPIGTWELRRGKEEEYTPVMFRKALESIFNEGDTVFFDFLLIPNIKQYTSGLSEDYDYYPEYTTFLYYAKLLNCQVLIQNSDTNWIIEKVNFIPENPKENTVYEITNDNNETTFMAIIDGKFQPTNDREIINQYGNDYVFNYTEDIENRLVYFYRPMKVLGNQRPAYYLYIDGLLKDTYSISVNNILYNTPVKNPYEDSNSVEERLQKYKSNYLVDNNQIYYYKKYQNGENFSTSNWMRFIIGKVQRELEKNKWEFLSERMSGNIKNTIVDILDKITESFSIVRRIILTKFKLDYTNYKLDLSIETYMSDLIDSNISLDITLNYNK